MTPTVSSVLLRTQTDGRLADLVTGGSDAAFEALAQRYRRPLLSHCRRLRLSDARAEDVVQQALLAAWTSLRAGNRVNAVRPWLYRITHNAALNAHRRSGYDYDQLPESLPGSEPADVQFERRSVTREALAALAALPDHQREVLIRTAIDGDSHEDVARDLGLSPTRVRGLVYRARCSVRAAATALAPPPLIQWAAGRAHGSASGSGVALDLVAGVAPGGAGAVLVKGAALVVTLGALAGGAASLSHHSHRSAHGLSAAHGSTTTAPRAAWRASPVRPAPIAIAFATLRRPGPAPAAARDLAAARRGPGSDGARRSPGDHHAGRGRSGDAASGSGPGPTDTGPSRTVADGTPSDGSLSAAGGSDGSSPGDGGPGRGDGGGQPGRGGGAGPGANGGDSGAAANGGDSGTAASTAETDGSGSTGTDSSRSHGAPSVSAPATTVPTQTTSAPASTSGSSSDDGSGPTGADTGSGRASGGRGPSAP